MKRKVILLLIMCSMLSLTACDANSINTAVNSAGDKVGIDVELNLKQEDLDKLEETIKDTADTARDIITDEEVHESVRDLMDTISDTADKNNVSE